MASPASRKEAKQHLPCSPQSQAEEIKTNPSSNNPSALILIININYFPEQALGRRQKVEGKVSEELER